MVTKVKPYNIVDLVKQAAKTVTLEQEHKRTINDVFASAASEFGELGQEIIIENGASYKKAGPDGIVGEAIDTILCCLDLIMVHDPSFTNEQFLEMAQKKLDKWTNSVKKHNADQLAELKRKQSECQHGSDRLVRFDEEDWDGNYHTVEAWQFVSAMRRIGNGDTLECPMCGFRERNW